MKILFINKYDITGGAAITASRLAKGLHIHFNTDNYFLVGIKKSDSGNVFETRKAGIQNGIERGTNLLFNMAGLQYKWFPFSTKNILRKAKEIKPDVISLHNLHGGYFKTSLLQQLSQIAPLYWTLHDMWAFTANAAHTYGDESWKNMKTGAGEKKHFPQIGLNTGNWLLKRKKEIYKNLDLTIITPSKWLLTLASQSPVLAHKSIYQIYNGIDTGIFQPHNKQQIRKSFGIPASAVTIIFGAENVIKNAYKGGKDLLKILAGLNLTAQEKIHLLILGKGDFSEVSKFENFVLHETGYVFDENVIAKYLAAADLMIYPTLADNLPNALIEAAACGLPAVSFDVGGCSEIIKDNYTGLVIPPGNIELFVHHTKKLLNSPGKLTEFSVNARKLAEEKFSLKEMAVSYFNAFKITDNYIASEDN